MQKRWSSFDCLKGLACIGVVLIHFNFNGNLGIAVKSFCRYGVPVFFLVSGFFFLSDGSMDERKVAKKIRHIFSLTVFSGAFYAVFAFCINSYTSSTWTAKQYIAQRMTADKIVKFFVTNDPFVYSHLWFLLGLIYCYLFAMLFFDKQHRINYTKWLAPLLLICYSCLQEFGAVLGIQRSVAIPGMDNRIYLYNLFVFRAVPFFLFGMLLCKYQQQIRALPVSKRCLAVLVPVGGGIAILERFVFGESQFFVGTYLMVAAMFILAIKVPEYDQPVLRHIGQDLSLYIYILHIAVGRCVDMAFGMLKLRGMPIYAYGRCLVILIASILLAEAIHTGKRTFLARK